MVLVLGSSSFFSFHDLFLMVEFRLFVMIVKLPIYLRGNFATPIPVQPRFVPADTRTNFVIPLLPNAFFQGKPGRGCIFRPRERGICEVGDPPH